MKLKELESVIEIPEGIIISLKDNLLIVKGKKGEVSRKFISPGVKLCVEDKKIKFVSAPATKREKKMIYCFTSHVKNMIKGSTEGHFYKLKICSGHFPMTAAVQGKEFVVKNFLGEKFPRRFSLRDKVTVKVEGDFVTVESCFKELASQTAADIETLTKIRGRDPRIFQDGIWIIHKDGKDIK